MTTPPTPTDEAAALAKAMLATNVEATGWVHYVKTEGAGDQIRVVERLGQIPLAESILAALAAAGWSLTRGSLDAAWGRVDRALPRGYTFEARLICGANWVLGAWPDCGDDGPTYGDPDDPSTGFFGSDGDPSSAALVAALASLAEALEARGQRP